MAMALFPFKNPITEATVLGRNRDAHVHVIHHQMSLHDLAFFLLRQRMKDRTQLTADIPKDGLTPSLGHEYHMVLAVPFGVG